MSNKSSSFSSYYYTITDLLEAKRIALAYCKSNINPSEMINYDVNDSGYFEFLIRVDKSQEGFVADIAKWKHDHENTNEYKFNYVLVLGANDIIKAIVSIPDVIDVSEWDTDTITIEFDYNVSSEVLEYDIGTLVSVHISDTIREEVHKGLLETGATLSAYDVRTQTNSHQYFRNTVEGAVANDTIHYSGEICRCSGNNNWSKIIGDRIDISNVPESADIIKILDTKKLVTKDGGNYYIDNHLITDVTGDIECISNSYIVTKSGENTNLYRYSLMGDSLSIYFINRMKCQYFLNSLNNELIFYNDRTHYSKNFKVFERIDDSKSNKMVQTELDSIRYLTNVLYLKEMENTGNGYDVVSYLHKSNGTIIGVAIDAFITDTLFIGHSLTKNPKYYLYEDTVDGLKNYVLGITDYWYNIYLISKCRTNPYIKTGKILTYKGLVYYRNNDELISI